MKIELKDKIFIHENVYKMSEKCPGGDVLTLMTLIVPSNVDEYQVCIFFVGSLTKVLNK